MRRELAAVLENRAALDMTQDFQTLADDLPETQRSLLTAYSSMLTPLAMAALQEQLTGPRGVSKRNSWHSTRTPPTKCGSD
ncbi:hypothetical protein ACJBCE_00385 [Streptomyces sp. NBUL23]|uniref:hypothetical protein n=1 Tax=Streptomyces sp. NBUL23 TaxID=3381354 RepID=UPI0038720DBC